MATIDVRRPHSLPLADIKQRAEQFAKTMEEKFSLVWKWMGDNISFDAPTGIAKGTKGQVSVTTSFIQVELDLPFLLRPLKGTIESKVNEKLNTLI